MIHINQTAIKVDTEGLLTIDWWRKVAKKKIGELKESDNGVDSKIHFCYYLTKIRSEVWIVHFHYRQANGYITVSFNDVNGFWKTNAILINF